MTINLLEKWDQIGQGQLVTIAQIVDTVIWLNTYLAHGTTKYIRDMKWSSIYFLNLMDLEINQGIVSTLNWRNYYSCSFLFQICLQMPGSQLCSVLKS
mmetsp:Transcript_24777/g.36342  ORF Transcript_24777/g.36342 Transcript_24777/m.36342 type:complete len:98 (-) Transcript_24777:118-411(-)